RVPMGTRIIPAPSRGRRPVRRRRCSIGDMRPNPVSSRRPTACAWLLIAALTGPALLRPAAAAVVEGVVLRAGGAPVGYADVWIVGQKLGAVADQRGRFQIAGVPPGRWAITVRSLGTPAVTDTVTVAAHDSLHLTFRLAASALDRPALLRDSLRTI